ncbi:MAG: hypothetical protein ACTHM6_12935 [Tepidisphaeraceae bacterium]
MNRTRIILSPLAVMAMLSTPSLSSAADAPASTQPQDRVAPLLSAIERDDAAAFTEHATPAMKSALTPAVIGGLHESLGKRLAGKHTVTYLCELNQKGYDVYLWKLSFEDGGDDVVIRAVYADEKLAGFFLQ